MDALITASCGAGLVNRLGSRGVRVLVTGETDPLTAARALYEDKQILPATSGCDCSTHGDKTHNHSCATVPFVTHTHGPGST
jgi:hypothetical protein